MKNIFVKPNRWDGRELTFVGFVSIILAVFVLLLTVSVYIPSVVRDKQCRDAANKMDFAYDYGLWLGCKVDVPGVGWRDIDSVRVNYDG